MASFGISKEGLQKRDDEAFCSDPEYLGMKKDNQFSFPENIFNDYLFLLTLLAPEVLEGQLYSKASDWWSFGILLFEMLTGLVTPEKGFLYTRLTKVC